MSIRIVTDSTCDLPGWVIARYGICVIPMYINAGSQSYLDGIDITRDVFYQKLPGFPVQPTTAVPSMQKFHAMYEALADQGASEILSIHISSTLSATFQVAQSAANEVTSIPVTAIDSRQLSLGTGFLVETAARMAQSGCSAMEIKAALDEQNRRTHVCAALDTLVYLHRSGRMNSLMSTIGEFLHIKPLLMMHEGVATNEKVRTHRHAMQRLLALINEYGPFEKLAFLHSNAHAYAQSLLHDARKLIPNEEVWLEQINPVLGAHIGPGVVGFACISKR